MASPSSQPLRETAVEASLAAGYDPAHDDYLAKWFDLIIETLRTREAVITVRLVEYLAHAGADGGDIEQAIEYAGLNKADAENLAVPDGSDNVRHLRSVAPTVEVKASAEPTDLPVMEQMIVRTFQQGLEQAIEPLAERLAQLQVWAEQHGFKQQ